MAEAAALEAIDTAALARRIAELPALPQALMQVVQALNSASVSAQRSIDLIEQDQSLAARTMRLANAAFYGVPGRIGTIGDAVRMLGLRTVMGVLSAAAIHRTLRADACAGFDFALYWRHAIATGLAARGLAPAAGYDADEAFLAGLMHDIGQLVFAVFHPAPAAQALARARNDDIPAERAETLTLGVSHARVGALLAQHWRFPASIVSAIAAHHTAETEPAGARPSFGALVLAADAVAHALDLGGHDAEAVPPVSDGLWQCLGMGPDAALRLFAAVEDGTLEMTEILR